MSTKCVAAVMGVALFAGCASLEERLTSTDYDTRKEAETELYANAIRTGNQEEVLRAISKISCDELLAGIAAAKNPIAVKKAAIGNIKDDKWLASVAVYAGDADVQATAIGKMKNQNLLLQVYKVSDNESVKMGAVAQMTSETIANLPYSTAMAKRWKDVTSQKLLMQIAKNDFSAVEENQRLNFVERISDKSMQQDLLRRIYIESNNEVLKENALSRMTSDTMTKIPYSNAIAKRWKEIDNQQLLLKIIVNDFDSIGEASWIALVGKITDVRLQKKKQRVVAYLYAKKCAMLADNSKQFILGQITDQAILDEMLDKEQTAFSREVSSYKSRMEEAFEALEKVRWQFDKQDAEEKRLVKDLADSRKEFDKSWQSLTEFDKKSSNNQARKKQHEAWREELKSEIDNCDKKKKELIKELACRQQKLDEIKDDPPRCLYVKDEDGRMSLYSKFGDEDLQDVIGQKIDALFSGSKIAEWDEVSVAVQLLSQESVRIKYYSQILAKLDSWSNDDFYNAQWLVDSWPISTKRGVIDDMLAKNVKGSRYLLKYASPEKLVTLIKSGTMKDPNLQMRSICTVPTDMLDVALYNAVKNDGVREEILGRMSSTMKAKVKEENNKAVKAVFARSESAKGFALKGFYLGMPIEDALLIARYYLPKSNVVIMPDATNPKCMHIEIDDKHIDNRTLMYFCRADEEGKVYLFNFDKKHFLSNWFKYDVQNYKEWAIAYGEEFGCDFRSKEFSGRKDIENVFLSVTQEAYQYRNNSKHYIVTYFGEKDVVDPNTNISFSQAMGNASNRDEAYRAGRKLGIVSGVRAWVKHGWENEDGAREGTLRVQAIKED